MGLPCVVLGVLWAWGAGWFLLAPPRQQGFVEVVVGLCLAITWPIWLPLFVGAWLFVKYRGL